MSSNPLSEMNFDLAWSIYRRLAPQLPPKAQQAPTSAQEIHSFDEISDLFDIIILDSFGVLNIGIGPVAGMPERVRRWQQQGKCVMVLTNAASYDISGYIPKFEHWGYTFQHSNVFSSRLTLLHALERNPPLGRFGVIGVEQGQLSELPIDWVLLGDDPAGYAKVDQFIWLSTLSWNEQRQQLMMDAMKENPRPIWVGNPDVTAPLINRWTSEPASWIEQLQQQTPFPTHWYGKPHAEVFSLLLDRVKELHGAFDLKRVLMVGDTPQTDILGGINAELTTVLMTDYGLLREQDVPTRLAECKIHPHYWLHGGI